VRGSRFFIATQKEVPAEAEIVSHRLMLRAGLIRRLAAGIYSWLPAGLRVQRKVEAIVREEMNRAGAVELSLPVVQPAELWQESGRWNAYGPELLRLKDRHERDFVIQPTSEEVITEHARAELKSYRKLPVNLYQIQTKFRDERRPRFGIMRGREFVMKDAYSFHASYADLEREYRNMYDAYSRIFTRLGLQFRAVAADTGSIGGTGSHEFHVLADSGEDAIAWAPESNYAANVELAEALAPSGNGKAGVEKLAEVETPGKTTCEEVAELLKIPIQKTVKAIAIIHNDEVARDQFGLVLIRGDHTLNEIKLEKVIGKFRFASEAEITRTMKCRPGYIGPVNLPLQPANIPGQPALMPYPIRLVVDRTVAAMSDFVCGANKPGFHLRGVNWTDIHQPVWKTADVRNVVDGDPSPDGKGKLQILRGIEVGHIFQLRTKYSEAMKASFLDEKGENKPFEMGCYGIGVTRIVAAAIEQNHDERGIIFPAAIAPFEVALVPVGYHKSAAVREAAERLYAELGAAGIDVLLDDRDERPGVLFADMDLLGVPHRVVLSDRALGAGTVEYKARRDAKPQDLPASGLLALLREKLAAR